MDWIAHGVVFCAAIWLMHRSSDWIIGSLMNLSKVLGIREFIVGFFVMAAASSMPNLFLGITSATQGVSELSLGDVFGNNFVAMTLAVIVAIIFAPKKEIETGGQTIQTTAIFTMCAALLPVLLIFDGLLSKADGIILIGFFFVYLFWLIKKQDLFSKVYNHVPPGQSPIDKIRGGIKDIGFVGLALAMLVAASIGVVYSATFFAHRWGVPILIVGLLVTGLGNALPEIYFAIASSKKRETQLIIGNLMGSVIFPATLVLGIVALIQPIVVANFQFALSSRIFLFIAAILFFSFTRSKNKISLGEGSILLALYIAFVAFLLF
jgi:cation:H+ antiporter